MSKIDGLCIYLFLSMDSSFIMPSCSSTYKTNVELISNVLENRRMK